MHNTRTGIFRNPGSTEDLEAAIGAPALEEIEQRFVLLADDRGTLELLENGVPLDLALLEDIVEAALHADVHLLSRVVLEAHIVECGVDSQG